MLYVESPVLHTYKEPPEAVSVAVSPEQIDALPTLDTGTVSNVTVPVDKEMHPRESLAITE